MKKPAWERAARALCSLNGLPENTMFEGRPMWRSFVPQVQTVLRALREPPPGAPPGWTELIEAMIEESDKN